MTATVETDEVFYGLCHECGAASPVWSCEEDAQTWAATHNAEYHETDNSNDEDYERFKEARDGD